MKAAFAAVLLLAAHVATAAPARWHFTFEKTWEISILFEREEKGDSTRLLVSSPAGRFVFLSSQDLSGRDSSESIRRLPRGETLTRRLVLSSFKEIPSCSSVRPPDACVVFTGENGSFGAPISAFAGSTAQPLRGKAGALVSPGMRDALFALAPLLPAVAEFGSYSRDFLGLVWPERFAAPQKLVRGERGPGCNFDATFGFPCSDEEKARETKRFADPRR
ncbi:MAG: hypothetical protein IPL89_05850 [Acidobacteria bacterium]|nr:hypothetical protein [Acidobacteriota bacterium]